MEKPLNTFETLLETYVYKVASAAIDQLDSTHQDKLVNLVISCNKRLVTSPPLRDFDSQSATKRSAKAENQSIEDELRAQWQTAVNLPSRGHVAYLQRQLVIHQTHIDLLLPHIARLEKLLEQAAGKRVAQSSELIRLTQYQTLQDRYILEVAKSRADQQKISVQLNVYYESVTLETQVNQ